MVARFEASRAGYRRSRSRRRTRGGIGEAAAGAGRGGKAPKPIVIDRYKFKPDGAGYLLSGRHSTIYLFDVATKKLDRLTTAKDYDEAAPSWSPDGARIAFMSNHAADPTAIPKARLYVADARPGFRRESALAARHAGRPRTARNGAPTANGSPS